MNEPAPKAPSPFDEDGYIEFLEHQSFIQGVLYGGTAMAIVYGLIFAAIQYFWS